MASVVIFISSGWWWTRWQKWDSLLGSYIVCLCVSDITACGLWRYIYDSSSSEHVQSSIFGDGSPGWSWFISQDLEVSCYLVLLMKSIWAKGLISAARQITFLLDKAKRIMEVVVPIVIKPHAATHSLVIATGDQIKCTINLYEITDFSEFEYCWKHLG